jgi:hypothetical protein
MCPSMIKWSVFGLISAIPARGPAWFALSVLAHRVFPQRLPALVDTFEAWQRA